MADRSEAVELESLTKALGEPLIGSGLLASWVMLRLGEHVSLAVSIYTHEATKACMPINLLR